jgi:hypothetical protein
LWQLKRRTVASDRRTDYVILLIFKYPAEPVLNSRVRVRVFLSREQGRE